MRIFNILYVDIFGDWIGGGQRSLMDMARSLDPERFNPVIICPEEGKFVDLIRSRSITVEIVPMGTFKTINFISWLSTFDKLARVVKKHKIDLIHVNGLRAAIYCGAVAKYFKIPLVWHVRVPESGGVAERAAYAFADKIIVNSRAVGKKFANWWGSSDKVVVIYNGINLEEFKPGERKNKLVPGLGFGGNEPLVGIVGELCPKKGQKYFLEVAAKVIKELPQVKFLVVGEEHNSGEYKDELIKLADKLKISSSIYFLGFRDDMVDVLNSLALLAHCPESEGFGRVVVEAMALKVPVVATDTGGIPEIIKDGVNGFLVPVGDTEALTKTISGLLRDKAKAGTLGEAGRKTVEESFDLKRQIKKIEGIYREALQVDKIGAIKQYADLFLNSFLGNGDIFTIQPEHRRQLDEFADYLAGGDINFRSTGNFLKDRNNFLIENFLIFLISKKILKGSRLYRDLEIIKRQIREKAVTDKDYDERISITAPESLIGEYYDPGDFERKKRLEVILQNLDAAAGEKILDLGCGAGALVYHSALAGAAAWGIDYSKKSIEAAARLSVRYGFKDKATFLVRDVTNGALPFNDGFFDKVVAADFIEHITHSGKEKLIKEVRRVLKPGGALIIYTPNGIREFLGYLKRRLLRAFRAENDLNDKTRLHFGLIDRFRFEGLLRRDNLTFKRYHVDITRPYLAAIPLLNDLLSANFLWVIKKDDVYSGINSFLYRLFNIKNCYLCPICGYYGCFKTVKPETGERKNAQCPKCGSLERHRLQYLVFKEVTKNVDTKKMSMLHFAPENFFRNIFKNMFEVYVTADLDAANVDRKEDLTRLSIGDSAFDFIYASHVLEHIKDDISALSEIKRVLKQGGIAIIPVPVIGRYTIDYDKPNPHEGYHVRCPGDDYYERYKDFFTKVLLYKSTDFDEKYQLYIYENRSTWPDTMPLRPSVPGGKHIDIVPVCFK